MRNLSQLSVGPTGMAFNPNTGHSFVLNNSGTFILKALQAGSEPNEVVKMLTEKYSVRWEDAERDVTDFLGRLRTLGLL